jgi:long-chain acyl-CoA synthetase
MKISANKNIEQVCVAGINLPQPIAIIVLSTSGMNKSKSDLIFSLNKTLKIVNGKLESHERLHNFVIVKEVWSVENKLLTPTMKIKRNAIEKLYSSNYESWYSSDIIHIIS